MWDDQPAGADKVSVFACSGRVRADCRKKNIHHYQTQVMYNVAQQN
jgi:hypothetical protein